MIKIMIKLKQLLQQGKNDPGIFKAIFILGSPASGKSTLANNIIGRQQLTNKDNYNTYSSASPQGLKYVNIDDIFEKLVHDAQINTNFNQLSQQQYTQLLGGDNSIYKQSKSATERRSSQYINSRLGLIIDKTGANSVQIKKIYTQLVQLGYQCICIYVLSQLQMVKQRNAGRVQRQLKDQDIIDC